MQERKVFNFYSAFLEGGLKWNKIVKDEMFDIFFFIF